ncbi:hypothetical protein [uncultured Acetobacteroides sp.]|uniref:hypothetical protein n=1 Tax=uncultured Acetobacteroides sp. TaxID=1760811 RepID=UPI0029F45E04|nr:hypothetical protein [uncultured Acetobacteroides sp.]
MVDKLLSKLGVGFVLLFMVCELSYINSKSLLFLGNEFGAIDKLFAVVGSMAFSMVTVLVMRKSRERWIKVVFPAFDALLVFCGFNLQFAAQIASGHDNPVRLLLSVFMAVFTGLITYSLGLINYTDHVADANDSKRYAEDVERIKAESKCIIDDLERNVSCLSVAVGESESKVTELSLILDHEKAKRQRYENAAKDFMANHLCFLAWGAKKKNESNRTPDEKKAITLAEKIKAGESVKLEEVLA